MPRSSRIDISILEAALIGFQHRHDEIATKMDEIRSRLGRSADHSPAGASAHRPKKRTMSASARRRIAAVQRKRWAEFKKAKEAPVPKKRRMSAAGRKRIADAARRRWAAFRTAQKAALKRAKKSAVKKPAANMAVAPAQSQATS